MLPEGAGRTHLLAPTLTRARSPPSPNPSQVALIREFVSAVRGGQPLVKQMLMGGGKTTVVGPMLALMLADGEMLVVQTMPQVSLCM